MPYPLRAQRVVMALQDSVRRTFHGGGKHISYPFRAQRVVLALQDLTHIGSSPNE